MPNINPVRTFDPNEGNATLVWTADSKRNAPVKSYHDDIQAVIREREMRAIGFGKRESLCG